jgi:hypothetical protein
MTLQTGKDRFAWRRAVIGAMAGGVLAAGLTTGFGAPMAFAQPDDQTDTASDTRAPGDNCTGDDCAKPVEGETTAAAECPEGDEECAGAQVTMTADQALAIIATEYQQGDGGGQLSMLIDDVMTLRAQGYRPSNANKLAIQDALEHRPNQTPLVEALKETLAYQRKLQAQAAMNTQQQGPVAGPVPIMLPNGGMTVPLG